MNEQLQLGFILINKGVKHMGYGKGDASIADDRMDLPVNYLMFVDIFFYHIR